MLVRNSTFSVNPVSSRKKIKIDYSKLTAMAQAKQIQRNRV